ADMRQSLPPGYPLLPDMLLPDLFLLPALFLPSGFLLQVLHKPDLFLREQTLPDQADWNGKKMSLRKESAHLSSLPDHGFQKRLLTAYALGMQAFPASL